MAELSFQDEQGFNQIFKPVGSTPFRAQRRHDWFVHEAQRLGARRILELGCGTGEAAAYLAANSGADVVAVDISEKFLDHARKAHDAPNLHFQKLDIFADDLKALGTFDLVYGNGILHHLVVRLDEVLRALLSLTTPQGGLAFIEPNFLNPYCAFIFGTKIGRNFARLEPDEMAFKPQELRRSLAQAGWKHVDVTTRDFLVPGVPKSLIKPILTIEPLLEGSIATRWLAQSHFMTARR